MIVHSPYPRIVPLRRAIGDALDEQQVAIVRAYLDETASEIDALLDVSDLPHKADGVTKR